MTDKPPTLREALAELVRQVQISNAVDDHGHALCNLKALADARAALAAAEAEEGWRPKARPLDEWHEDFGDVLWWCFPVDEPPYVGTPLDTDWPGYHTHWTDIPIPLPPPPAGSEPR